MSSFPFFGIPILYLSQLSLFGLPIFPIYPCFGVLTTFTFPTFPFLESLSFSWLSVLGIPKFPGFPFLESLSFLSSLVGLPMSLDLPSFCFLDSLHFPILSGPFRDPYLAYSSFRFLESLPFLAFAFGDFLSLSFLPYPFWNPYLSYLLPSLGYSFPPSLFGIMFSSLCFLEFQYLSYLFLEIPILRNNLWLASCGRAVL